MTTSQIEIENTKLTELVGDLKSQIETAKKEIQDLKNTSEMYKGFFNSSQKEIETLNKKLETVKSVVEFVTYK